AKFPASKHPVAASVRRINLEVAEMSKEDGLYPDTPDDPDRPRYTAQQGLRAAHVAREDAAATFMLSAAILASLRRVEAASWMATALLLVILWRVSCRQPNSGVCCDTVRRTATKRPDSQERSRLSSSAPSGV